MASLVAHRNPSADFWSGRKVLVTGHTGFKGSWLCLWLLALNADVVGVSNGVPTERSLFADLRLADGLKDRRGDVRDGALMASLMEEEKPSVVLHLAAQSLVRLSYQEPVETYATNVMGTVNVLDAVRRAGTVDVALVVTSDKCYENREWIWGYREMDAMGGHDPYSSSKGCAELVASAYARSFLNGSHRTRVVSARAGNVFGGGDWAVDRLIPDLVRGFEADAQVSIRHPAAVRPWQHVLEPLSGYLLLCERVMADADHGSQGWNFGPNASAEVPVRTIADKLCEMWPKPAGWVDASDGKSRHEAHLLTLDSTKARTLLAWSPRWGLDEALRATIEAYRASGSDRLKNLLVEQIKSYEQAGGLVG